MPGHPSAPRTPFRVAAELRVDDFIARIKAKFESVSAFKDIGGQQRAAAKHFEKWDLNLSEKTYKLTFDQYFEAMTGLSFVGIKTHVEAFFYYFDREMSGYFDYSRATTIFYGLDPSYPQLKQESKISCEKLRVALIERYGSAAFHTLDSHVKPHLDNSGKISRSHLEQLVEFLVGFVEVPPADEFDTQTSRPIQGLTSPDFRMVLNDLDTTHSGVITYSQLSFVLLAHAMSYDRRVMVRDIFQRFDSSGSGSVALSAMLRAADLTCHPAVVAGVISEMQAGDALASFATGNTMRLTGLFNYYDGISITIEKDTDFEILLRNTWAAVETPVSNPTLRRVLVSHSDGTQEIVDLLDDIGDGTRFDVHSAREKVRSRGINDVARLEL